MHQQLCPCLCLWLCLRHCLPSRITFVPMRCSFAQEFEKKEPQVKARAATNLSFLYVLEGQVRSYPL